MMELPLVDNNEYIQNLKQQAKNKTGLIDRYKIESTDK